MSSKSSQRKVRLSIPSSTVTLPYHVPVWSFDADWDDSETNLAHLNDNGAVATDKLWEDNWDDDDIDDDFSMQLRYA